MEIKFVQVSICEQFVNSDYKSARIVGLTEDGKLYTKLFVKGGTSTDWERIPSPETDCDCAENPDEEQYCKLGEPHNEDCPSCSVHDPNAGFMTIPGNEK